MTRDELVELFAGVWLAYYSDYSGIAVFPTELEALKHAQSNGMNVRFCRWGEVPR
jgi:hypothetical protein